MGRIKHFNPRSPCGERLIRGYAVRRERGISIHAPRAGSDRQRKYEPRAVATISIHAPRAGSDGLTYCHSALRMAFQSTLPVRGATCGSTGVLCIIWHFNPRSPCGERPDEKSEPPRIYRFQSTLPVRGATTGATGRTGYTGHFNPRSPCGERLSHRHHGCRRRNISIHAPRAGSDC